MVRGRTYIKDGRRGRGIPSIGRTSMWAATTAAHEINREEDNFDQCPSRGYYRSQGRDYRILRMLLNPIIKMMNAITPTNHTMEKRRSVKDSYC